ncbi:MAG: tail fiber protein [Methylorubrum rhodinum]|uniref:tail fiber protein n=1 Tax=Methylorubrum rhodinum TaxID=29428 RepID=UPI003BB0FB4A
MAALPALLARLFSYTGFQQERGDTGFPGTRIDADLDQLANGFNALRGAIGTLFRDDGGLKNGSVTRAALAADIWLGLGATRPWKTASTYAKDATVTQGYTLYVCLVAHASGVFATDLVAGRWAPLADLSQAVTIGADEIGREQLVDGAVGPLEIDDLAVLARHLADAVLQPRHAGPAFGRLPVGAVLEFEGALPPPGFLLANGALVSRTDYAALFEALTVTFTANATNGSADLSNVSRTLAGLGLIGSLVEGPGVPVGTQLNRDVDGSVRLTANVTANSTGGAFRILPQGIGDGATTFALPDHRGFVTAGRDNGTPFVGRLASFTSARINGRGGRETAALTNANLPVTLPSASGSVDLPAFDVPTRAQLINIVFGDAGAGSSASQLWQGLSSVSIDPPARSFTAAVNNSGGGQPVNFLQPTRTTNKIIFAGV